ncbi:MAG: translesion error-prone DNA polymerase V autoproteolytic subunit [Chitinophagaceae bacterium]|jgi:DNA polymerase V|nr:translesion error-prone DNA polymerase V autoproteolytic subunit [Chitinophagaceae bacterium]
MNEDYFFGSAYTGSKQFSQQEIKTANATGFGAAADDYMERGIDLNEELVRNKPATYFFRMKGDAMREAGIFDNDILVVDRSIRLAEGKVIVAVLNGELLVRRFHKNFSSAFLIPENNRYKPINLAEFSDFTVWGVVTFVIHDLSRG